MHAAQNVQAVKNVLKVKLSNNFKKFKINPNKTVDVESNSCYFLGVPRIPSDSFRSATRFPTLLGQYLCLIPLSPDTFQLYGVRTLLSVTMLACQIAMTVLSFVYLKRTEANVFSGGYALFFGSCAVITMMLIYLSSKWYNLLKKWEEVEGYFGHQKNLKMKFTFISIVCIIFSMVEHLSFLLTGILMPDKDTPQGKAFEVYVVKMFPHVFMFITYNTWIAMLVLVINSVATLTFCFSDQLIIMGSLTMGKYFQMFNERMKSHRGKILTPSQWKTLRVDYIRLCNLAKTLNDCLCHLLCVSLLIHLYIVCIEMNHGVLNVNVNKNMSERVHAILSFSVSTLRGCFLCLCSVQIYENSKLPIRTIYEIPQRSYCNEVELFMLQIQTDHVGLTGSHMFLMTRRFLLTIFSTIVSYEVILIQMKGINIRKNY